MTAVHVVVVPLVMLAIQLTYFMREPLAKTLGLLFFFYPIFILDAAEITPKAWTNFSFTSTTMANKVNGLRHMGINAALHGHRV